MVDIKSVLVEIIPKNQKKKIIWLKIEKNKENDI